MKICAWTVLLSRHIPRVRDQKKDLNADSNQHIGTSRGQNTTKIHAVVDGLGNPVHFMLTRGHISDSKATVELLSDLDIAGSNTLGDKAYGTRKIQDHITKQNAQHTIPPKINCLDPWLCDFHVYKERHLIECFFNKLKAFRRGVIRYDKLAASFLAFIYLAFIWLSIE